MRSRKLAIKQKFFNLGHSRCHYCCTQLNYSAGFKNSATIEHIVPKCKGGTLNQKNCLVVCLSCNAKRKNKDFLGFITGSRFPRQDWLKDKLKQAEKLYAV